MNQRVRLEHLLYTSRISFETIACSPGIDRQLRVQLERWASDYPVKRGDGRGAPLVIRGFPLEREDNPWGVCLLCYTGGDLSRPEGNYIAHAFVIPGPAFQQLGSNAAWIAAHVPFWPTYQSPPGAARAEIQPVEVEIDPLRQLRFARMLLAEYGKEQCGALVARAMRQLDVANEKAGALALPFGPLPENLPELLALVAEAGMDPPAPPPPDVFNLWRMAGLIALLPQKFAERAVFSLNELELETRYRLTVLKTSQATSLEPVKDEIPFVGFCLECLEREEFDDLFMHRDWHEQRLKAASVSELNGLSGLLALQKRLNAEGPLDLSRVSALLSQLQRNAASVNVQPFVLEAIDALARLPDGIEKRHLNEQLLVLIKGIKQPLDPLLVNALFAGAALRDLIGFQELIDAFPGPRRADLFRAAYDSGLLTRQRTPEEERSFVLWALSSVAAHLPDKDQQDLAQKAVDLAWTNPAESERSLERLLFASEGLAPSARAVIFKEVERRMCRPGESLFDFVQRALVRNTPSEAALLKLIARSESAVRTLVETFPPPGGAPGYGRFISSLRTECIFDFGPELELYAEVVTLLRLVDVEPAPDSSRSRPSQSYFLDARYPPPEVERALRPGQMTIPPELEAHTCITMSALKTQRLRESVLLHLEASQTRLNVEQCLLFVSAYMRALVEARCFATIEDVLMTIRRAASHVANWLLADRAVLRSERLVRPTAVFAKIVNAAAQHEPLDRVTVTTIAYLDELTPGRYGVWDWLIDVVDTKAYKRWRRIDTRPQVRR